MRRRLLLLVAVVVGAAAAAPVAHAGSDGTGGDPKLSVHVGHVWHHAVDCVDVEGAEDVESVVLVHGTTTEGHEQFAWNYELRLAAEGIPYCVVTYPHRGMGDMQVSAEYVVVAVKKAQHLSRTGKVDLVGHSQGATMPRWAVKHWPSVRAVVDDFVMLAGPNHGTVVADEPLAKLPLGPLRARPPVLWQFRTDSEFNRHLNMGDETPGDIDYTSLYAHTDELVQPSGIGAPPTAALDGEWGKVANINVQDACPGRLVDHFSIGTTDRFTMDLTIATLRAPGPADLSLVDTTACSLPDQYVTPATLPALLQDTWSPSGLDDLGYLLDPSSYVTEEPPIRDYARQQG